MPRTVTRLPDPARSQVILIGAAEYGTESGLPGLPAVANNLDDLHSALADPTHGWLTPHSGTKILNPASPSELGTTIADRSKRADDLVLIYYAGHGLLSSRGELYLATSHTNREQLRFTAFPFDWIREILNDTPAANRVVILDCCYSGRAIGAMSDPGSTAYDQLDINGTYILTSTTATTIAHAPAGARHTAFTGELIRVLRDGDPKIAELVTLDDVYRATYRALTRQGLPRPQQRGSNATPRLALVRNHAPGGQPVKTESPGPPDRSTSAAALAAEPPTAAASTQVPDLAERPVADPAGGWATTAKILCTVSSLYVIWSATSFIAGIASVSGPVPPWADLLGNGIWTVGDILVLVGTIQMWRRKSAGRKRASTGLSMVLASMLGFEIAALTTPHDGFVAPWMYPANVLFALSLAVLLSPGTSRDLKAGHASSHASASSVRKAARPRVEPSPRPEPLPGARSARQPGNLPHRVRARKAMLVAAASALAAATGVFVFQLMQHGGGCSGPPGAHSPASLACTLTTTLTDPGSQGVNSVALGPGGTTLATGDEDGSAYLWDTATGKLLSTLTGPTSQDGNPAVNSVAFSPNGTILAAAVDHGIYGGGSTYLWNTTTRKRTATLTDPDGESMTSVAFSPNGTALAVGDDFGHIYLWNAATEKHAVTLTDPDGISVNSLAFGPDGTTLAAGDGDGSIYLWDIATGKLRATLANPDSSDVQSVAFGPGGSTVLAASDRDGSVHLWNTATRKLAASFTDPNSENVSSLSFAPGGTVLAASDGYATVYLWDASTRTLNATLTNPDDTSVNSVAFGPGTILATGDAAGKIYLWRITRPKP